METTIYSRKIVKEKNADRPKGFENVAAIAYTTTSINNSDGVQRNETLLSWTLRSYFNDVSNVFHCKQFHNKYFRTCTTKTLSIR